MIVKVDADACIGCELCVQTCSECFQMDGDKAVAINETVAAEAEAACKQAAEDCPVDAIAVE